LGHTVLLAHITGGFNKQSSRADETAIVAVAQGCDFQWPHTTLLRKAALFMIWARRFRSSTRSRSASRARRPPGDQRLDDRQPIVADPAARPQCDPSLI